MSSLTRFLVIYPPFINPSLEKLNMTSFKAHPLKPSLIGLAVVLTTTAAAWAQYPSTSPDTSAGSSTASPRQDTPGTQGAGAGQADSGMGQGMGQGMGPGMGANPTPLWGDGITPGWSLMTQAERQQHEQRMRSINSYDECKSYMAQHQREMEERANQAGTAAMVRTPRDVCERMPR